VIRVDDNGWIAQDGGEPPEVRFVPTARTYHDVEALGLVWHTTDTPTGVSGAELADRIVKMPEPGQRSASWNFLIDRFGVLHVSAPVTRGTWHVKGGGRIGGRFVDSINHSSISVELENGGRLKLINGKCYCDPFEESPKYLVENRGIPSYTKGGLFEGFTVPQCATAEALVRALAAFFPSWGREGFEHGHVDYNPQTREDPGPIWRENLLPAILDRVFGG